MKTRIPLMLLAMVLALTLGACAAETPAPDEGASPPADDSTGLRLANGLYDQEDGTVLALGTLEWIDLEGGFYALTGSPEGDGNIAVIANAGEFEAELEALLGKTVSVTGTRFSGVSVRMAGPEIVITSIEEMTDTPGAAE
ncbi:MAG: hypothetical protein Q7W51_00405 [Coriobacteriia bacterium]|nr:hypothetical protein [Coriobacteriia bacterium]